MDLLEKARGEINKIDAEMAELFVRRMRAVESVAEYKKDHGLPIFDASREEEVLRHGCARVEDEALRRYYADFLRDNMKISRSYQRELLCQRDRTLHVNLSQNGYDIIIERGTIGCAGELLQLDRRVLIVTDDGVPQEYVSAVAAYCKEPTVVTVPVGEASKSFSVLETICQRLLTKGFTRTDCVVAVGGGVVGDLAGFAAASYLRGVDFYNIPTTLLAQVDSSIGGKVAINLGNVKNTVGAFYQPKRVLIDPDVLKTLPRRQFANGLAEAIKMALTFDAELFALFEEGRAEAEIDQVIERSLRIKKYVVEQDERETGLRRVLNFGHTLGHGIEAMQSFHSLYHGECVAIGMLFMCSERVRARLLPILNSLELPTEIPVELESVLEIASHDKKCTGEDISVVWVEEIGSFEICKMPLSEWKEQIRVALCNGKD